MYPTGTGGICMAGSAAGCVVTVSVAAGGIVGKGASDEAPAPAPKLLSCEASEASEASWS